MENLGRIQSVLCVKITVDERGCVSEWVRERAIDTKGEKEETKRSVRAHTHTPWSEKGSLICITVKAGMLVDAFIRNLCFEALPRDLLFWIHPAPGLFGISTLFLGVGTGKYWAYTYQLRYWTQHIRSRSTCSSFFRQLTHIFPASAITKLTSVTKANLGILVCTYSNGRFYAPGDDCTLGRGCPGSRWRLIAPVCARRTFATSLRQILHGCYSWG